MWRAALASFSLHAIACDATVLTAAPPHVLTPELLAEFERRGHVATRSLLTKDEFHAAVDPLWAVARAQGGAAAARKAELLADQSTLPFAQVTNPHELNPAARRLATLPALLATAAALLGVASVRLYQTSLFQKRPKDAETAWHADLWTVPLNTNNYITLWLPLHRVEAEDAPLFYQTGTHLFAAAEDGEDGIRIPPPGELGVHHCPLEPGDATWHHGWTMHGSPPLAAAEEGRAAPSRLAFTASYFADQEHVVGDALSALASRRRGHSSIEVEFAAAKA
eukprot:TRINITY_DN2404_c0_g1_i2.p1 TRINITY_DN2404_c0_g1~~TRINITY_DN2404_c0_g1_i2.p1  ORF type:complete len:280 (+),score=64.64 TRINITY_DN2404_c0_g1_i2:82-921(+)